MSEFSIQISVKVQYLEQQSNPDEGQYHFAYTVTIRNDAPAAFQLIGRQWLITDGHDLEQEVRGLGVVGQQPLLKTGESFEYTSWTSITTPSGKMSGKFFCVSQTAEFFEAPIPEFVLVMPRILH